jgi:hypothetical protein
MGNVRTPAFIVLLLAWQRSFTIPAAFPALGISDESFTRMRSQGWKRCTGMQDKWSDYVDRSRGAPATVYQRGQLWHRGNDVLQITYSQRVSLSFKGAQSAEDMERSKTAYGPCDG